MGVSDWVRELRRRFRVFQLRARGYSARMARTWVARVERESSSGRYSRRTLQRAHSWGFLAETVDRLGITAENRSSFIAERDYWFIQPLNGAYGKWVRDRISALSIFDPHRELFETAQFQCVWRDHALQLRALTPEARAFGNGLDGLARYLSASGPLRLTSSQWDEFGIEVAHADGRFLRDGTPIDREDLERFLAQHARERSCVFVDPLADSADSPLAGARIRVSMLNADGARPRAAAAMVEWPVQAAAASGLDDGLVHADERLAQRTQRVFAEVDLETGAFGDARMATPQGAAQVARHPESGLPLAGAVPAWSRLQEQLEEMCRFAPLLTFVEFSVVVTQSGPKITGIAPEPSYSTLFPVPEGLAVFLREEIAAKSQAWRSARVRLRKWLRNAKLFLRKRFAIACYPRGLVPYQSVRWLGDVRRDFFARNGVPWRTKLWAYRNGLLSYRLPQYGITPGNREEFISDFEYRWLRHINTEYRYWLEDKISIRYVASRHRECLPAYYFLTAHQRGELSVIPLMDCPPGFTGDVASILRLARERGVLALKPDEGSHGEGFIRLEYDAGIGYSINAAVVTEEHLRGVLADPANRYLVTEFIEMHPDIARFYPESVNTVRMVVVKPDGMNAVIGNAYLRVGTRASGFVDNTAVGGLVAEIDFESGRIGNAQALRNGRVEATPHHPDTGVLVEGVVPDWEGVKRKVLEIANDLPQLEFLGFDLAITPRGILIPEINRFPDYPRIDRLSPVTTAYLLEKIEKKKRMFGYDVSPPARLISLPKRSR